MIKLRQNCHNLAQLIRLLGEFFTGEKGFVVMTIEILMIVGFCLAAYSIVGNDVPQTLGTFISSNAHRPWWLLWAYPK